MSSVGTFTIAGRAIGDGQPCLIVGEVAQSHDGSLGMAHAFIDAIADAGADAVKFQTHIAAAESTAAEPWRVRFSSQDASRYDYWKRMEFTEEQWKGLASHAAERGLIFLSSPFSVEAVDLLERIGIRAWKVASGEIGNLPLLERIAETGKPVLLSTGMSSLREIDAVVEWLKKKVPVLVMQSASVYPCPPEKVGLNLIPVFRERYGCPVGLSDHSGSIYPGLAATMLGMQAIEVHVTLSREMFGPDVPASLTTSELKLLVEGVRFIEKMRSHPVDKDQVLDEVAPMRAVFTKSVVARMSLKAGTVLRHDHVTLKKPGTGIPPDRLSELIDRRLLRDVAADEQLREEDLA